MIFIELCAWKDIVQLVSTHFYLCTHSENIYPTVCQSNFHVLSVTRHSLVNLIETLMKKTALPHSKTICLSLLCMSVLNGKTTKPTYLRSTYWYLSCLICFNICLVCNIWKHWLISTQFFANKHVYYSIPVSFPFLFI